MNEDGQLTDWLKWITGGIIAGMLVFWQWMERKVDRLSDRIDKLRDDTRHDRHDLADKVHTMNKATEGEIGEVRERLTKIERDTH